jgi:hypothetical protein
MHGPKNGDKDMQERTVSVSAHASTSAWLPLPATAVTAFVTMDEHRL